MSIKVTQDLNLLKKYHKPLVYDYTEYPTKSYWDESFDSETYEKALTEWLSSPDGTSNTLFYVHTPFCEELCYFCLCSKEITRDYEKVKDYLYNVLFKEIDLLTSVFKKIGKTPNFKEIYFGGGSPTYYQEAEFTALKLKLSELINFSNIETWTVEIDPRRVDTNRLKYYAAQGVNRLSFGIQDFDIDVQKEINRIQPPKLLQDLLTNEIRDLFPVINFDLLIGLPKQTTASIQSTIESVIELQPTELQTMYVHYKPEVRKYMTRMVRNGPMPDFYDRKAIFLEASEKLLRGGYKRAGFESYALPTDELISAMESHEAYYNSLGTQKGLANNFIAVGSSAHGSFGDYYFQNFYERELYVESINKNEFPVYRGIKLSQEDILRRKIIKQIRTYFEINFQSFDGLLNSNFESHFSEELQLLQEFEKDGLIKFSGRSFCLTELGQHFSPQVCEVFDKRSGRDVFDPSIKPIHFLKNKSL